MINYIIINGTNSNTINGLGINELPPISKPPLRVQTEEIDGRDGDISTNLGYGAYDKTISIGLFGTGYDINEVISFFNGEGTVVFSNEPNKYYKYKIINQIDYEALLKFKSATITFHCQPFKYPTTETPLEIEYEYIEQDNVESATLNNTNGNTHLDISLKGNTSQYSTTGKNLLKLKNTTSGGLTTTLNSDGSISVSGTATGTVAYLDTGESVSISAGALALSIQSTLSVPLRMALYNGSTGIGTMTINAGQTSTTNTFSQEITNYNLYLYNLVAGTTYNFTIKPMLESGSTATDFEPYTGNQPSPSPDFPQQIHEVSGDNEINVCGKNLFNKNATVLGHPNCSYTFNNGVFTLTNTNNNNFALELELNLPAGAYVLNSDTSLSESTQLRNSNLSPQVQHNFAGNYSNQSFTISNEVNKIVFNYGATSTPITLDLNTLMIRKNGTSSTYEPYNEDTYELDLGVENLVNAMQESFTLPASETTYQKIISNTSADNKVHLVANTKYYISYTIENASTSNTRSTPRLYLDSSNYYQKTETNRNITAGRKVEEYTPTTTGDYSVEYWLQGSNVDVVVSDYMISTENGSYSPYGQAPIKMRGIGTYEDYFVRNSGKNLLQLNDITLSANSTTDLQLAKDLPIGTYNFNGVNIVGDGRFNLYGVDENNTQENLLTNELTKNIVDGYSFTTTKIYKQVKIYVNVAVSGKIQLAQGNSAVPYEPFGTGQWCKYNSIGEVVLNGSESWQQYSESVYLQSGSIPKGNSSSAVINGLSNYVDTTTNVNIRYNSSSHDGIQINNLTTYWGLSAYTTTAWSSWLSTHNLILCYPLASPYLSLIEDETLISQLDAIEKAMSYDGTTNVSQVNNDKPFLLDLIAMEKGTDEVVINNIGNVYAKPTIALEGTGETDIYLNNTEILKVDLSEKNKITIDTNNMEAYDPTDNSLANRKVIGNYNSMTLPSGNTTMKITGALTKATITDYSRWL